MPTCMHEAKPYMHGGNLTVTLTGSDQFACLILVLFTYISVPACSLAMMLVSANVVQAVDSSELNPERMSDDTIICSSIHKTLM